MYIYGVLMCLRAHKYTIKRGGCPKIFAAPHQGAVLRVPRGQERKKRKGRALPFRGWVHSREPPLSVLAPAYGGCVL